MRGQSQVLQRLEETVSQVEVVNGDDFDLLTFVGRAVDT